LVRWQAGLHLCAHTTPFPQPEALAFRPVRGQPKTALTELEAEQFAEAVGRAGALLMSHRGDAPLLLTLSRATAQLIQAGTFYSVWEPPGK
jgi:hypothetical protein